MNIKKALLLSILLSIAIISSAYCAISPKDLLPASGKIKGFSVLAGTLQYGKGDDISIIYDGGYELYIAKGVIDAVRQLYQRKSDYVEITTHTMKSAKAAKDITMYWVKENKAKKTASSAKNKAKWEIYTSQLPSTTITYGYKGIYFFTITTLYKGDKATQDIKLFTNYIVNKIP